MKFTAIAASEPVSDQKLTARFWSRMRNISILQCYVPMEISDSKEKEAFYAPLNAVQERFPKGGILIVMCDVNTLFEHVVEKHGFGDQFHVDFPSFPRFSLMTYCSGTELFIKSVWL